MTTEEKLEAAREDHRVYILDHWDLVPTDPKYHPSRQVIRDLRERIAELEEQLRLEEVERLWPNGLAAHP